MTHNHKENISSTACPACMKPNGKKPSDRIEEIMLTMPDEYWMIKHKNREVVRLAQIMNSLLTYLDETHSLQEKPTHNHLSIWEYGLCKDCHPTPEPILSDHNGHELGCPCSDCVKSRLGKPAPEPKECEDCPRGSHFIDEPAPEKEEKECMCHERCDKDCPCHQEEKEEMVQVLLWEKDEDGSWTNNTLNEKYPKEKLLKALKSL